MPISATAQHNKAMQECWEFIARAGFLVQCYMTVLGESWLEGINRLLPLVALRTKRAQFQFKATILRIQLAAHNYNAPYHYPASCPLCNITIWQVG